MIGNMNNVAEICAALCNVGCCVPDAITIMAPDLLDEVTDCSADTKAEVQLTDKIILRDEIDFDDVILEESDELATLISHFTNLVELASNRPWFGCCNVCGSLNFVVHTG